MSDYKTIYFCLSPANKYVGWTIYENGYYFGSGNTLDEMDKNVRATLYFKKKISRRGFTLASAPTKRENVPLDKMSKMFLSKSWYGHKMSDSLTAAQVKFNATRPVVQTEPKKETPAPVEQKYDYYSYKVVDGKLCVYGCKLINEFPLETAVLTTPTAEIETAEQPEQTEEKREVLHLPKL